MAAMARAALISSYNYRAHLEHRGMTIPVALPRPGADGAIYCKRETRFTSSILGLRNERIRRNWSYQ